MADDLYVDDTKNNNVRTWLIAAAVLIGLLATAKYLFVSDDAAAGSGKPIVSNSTAGEAANAAESGNPNTGETGANGDIWRSSTEEQIGSIANRQDLFENKMLEKLNEIADDIQSSQAQNSAEIKRVALEAAQTNKTKNVNQYRERNNVAGSKLGEPTNDWAVNPNDFGGTDLAPEKKETQARRYVRLGSKRYTPTVGAPGQPANSNDTGDTFLPNIEDLRFDRQKDKKKSKPQERSSTNNDAESQFSSNENNTTKKSEPKEGVDFRNVQIAAASIAHVTPMVTTQCPIASTAQSNADVLPAAPVYLIVRASFKEPNGHSTDLGNVHLIGRCVATYVDSKYGEAYVEVQHLSIKDPILGAQKVPAKGRIALDATRSINIKAPLRKMPKSALMSLHFTSGLKSVADIATQTQFSQGLDGGAPTQSFTGTVSDTVASAFSQGTIGSWQQRVAAINATMFDSVPINAAIKLTFLTDDIITVKVPIDDFSKENHDDEALI